MRRAAGSSHSGLIGYHLYLKKMGEAWPAERELQVAETEVLPYADDPMEVAACNMYQELVGFLIYRSLSRQVKDPFLARMLAQFAKDECRHFRFYQDVVARHVRLRQNEYLFGTEVRPFWSWYYKGVVDPCRSCQREPIGCDCQHYEDGEPAPIRNPDWWRQVSTSRSGRAAIPMEEWAATLIGERAPQVPRASA